MLDDKLLESVRALRARGMSPKEIARTLGLRPAVVAPIVRRVAQEESAEQPARGRVVGCWVSPGWRRGLMVARREGWHDIDLGLTARRAWRRCSSLAQTATIAWRSAAGSSTRSA